MEKVFRVIRIITVPPVFAIGLLLTVYSLFHNDVLSHGQLICGLIFLGLLPMLGYPLQKYIPFFRERGREGQRSLAMIFSTMGYVLGCAAAFLTKVCTGHDRNGSHRSCAGVQCQNRMAHSAAAGWRMPACSGMSHFDKVFSLLFILNIVRKSVVCSSGGMRKTTLFSFLQMSRHAFLFPKQYDILNPNVYGGDYGKNKNPISG